MRINCAQCLRPEAQCLCAYLPRLESRWQVLILRHSSEAKHALNTARLAVLGLKQCRLMDGEVFAQLPALLAEPGWQNWLLFPDASAQLVEQGVASEAGQQQRLIVLDGSWRKAKRLLHCNPCLAALPRLSFATPPPSRYRLRKVPAAEALSTIEAITYALEQLEGHSFQQLLAPFEALIEQQISAMGSERYQADFAARNAHLDA